MEETGEVPINVAEAAPKPVVVEPTRQVEAKKGVQVDARDYFVIGKFQKKAESIDPNKTHPWNTVHYRSFLAGNNFGVIAVGETYDAEVAQTSKESPFGLLIVERTSDGKASSAFVRGLDQSQRGYVMDAINTIAPSLSDETRHQFIKRIIQEAPTLKDERVIALRLARMGLELLPDFANTSQSEQITQWTEVEGKAPTKEQQAQLAEFTKLVASKMPGDRFTEHMQRFQDDLRFTDDPYGRNYQTIFTQMTQWVLDERGDTQRNYGLLQREKPDEYTINDKVTRPIGSEDELKTALASLPVEPMPDTRGRHRSNEVPEMVRLADIVGGTGIETWEVSTSEGRGFPKIFEFTQEFQKGNASVVGRNEPIRLIEVDGKFYVEGDGRHRTAALKALGVPEAPALVTHIK